MIRKDLIIPYHADLHPLDRATQTYGCRTANSNNCRANSLPGICAFVTEDQVCRKPSRAWPKKYLELRKGQSNFPVGLNR